MNENSAAIAFTKTNARPLANSLLEAYWSAKRTKIAWANGPGNVIPAGDSLVIDDGSPLPVTNDQVYGLMIQLDAFIALLEANGSAPLYAITKAASNP